jgi:DNA-directed RNA polymerase specialized sigma24 family protein
MPKRSGESEVYKKMNMIERTRTYLENYRDMKEYMERAVSELWQVAAESGEVYSDEVRECKKQTMITLAHIDQAMQALKEDAVAADESYKYDALEARYIKGESYEQIAIRMNCGKNTPKKWCKAMTEKLAIKLFGAKAL